MRLLFDQGAPVPLRRFLSSHTVTTVYEKGWSGIGNGDLLRVADQQMFEVFLTTHQRLRYQQNLTNRSDRYCGIADDKLASDPETHGAEVLDSIAPGDFIEIDF